MRPTRLIAATVAAVAVASLTAGCGSAPAPRLVSFPEVRGIAAAEPAVSPAAYATGDLSFGLALLRAWCAQEPSANIVLSPASLASGLGMAYLGARGSTATAMAAVLHLPSTGSLEAGLQARSDALRGLDGGGVTVAEADQVWFDPTLAPLHSYLDAVATGYAAGVGRVPLLTNPARAAAQIDASIAAATRGHIPHLLSAADLGNSVFVLTDALYLDARWASPFQQSNITSGVFTTAAGEHVQAKYLDGGGYTAGVADGWTAVSLPYRGSRLAMTALLPPAGSAAGCPALTAGVVGSVEAAMRAQRPPFEATIELPEVSLRSSAQMNQLLTALGMGVAFTQQADFTGLSPAAGLLGPVVHAATLRVDSAGTVASAATGVVVEPTAARGNPLPIVFSRPYLMLITDTKTGEPLFLARVANPNLP